jgi:hypothetical protein
LELAASMGASSVVMGLVLGQDRPQMPFAEDQHPVGDLGPGGEQLGLDEADVQAKAVQHPDEPQEGQEGARGDAAYGDGGGEQEDHVG